MRRALVAVLVIAAVSVVTTSRDGAGRMTVSTVRAAPGPHEVAGFRMIGLSWTGEAGSAAVRIRTGGVWSPWMDLEVDADEGPDVQSHERSGRLASRPLWVGEADSYELRGLHGRGALVHLVREAEASVRLRTGADPAGATGPAPSILDRSVWLARPPKTEPGEGRVRVAFVHHTVTANTYSPDEVPDLLRGMQAFHMDVNGWDDIGYNFLVDRFGRVWEGRAGGIERAVIGAQTEGFNSSSTGVSVIGTFTSDAPSQASVDAVSRLLAWKLPTHAVDPAGRTDVVSRGNDRYPDGQVASLDNVSGHRDAKATGCPGEQLAARLPSIRSEASLGAAAAVPYPLAFMGGVNVAAGQLDLDAPAELVTGADAGGGPHVRTFDGTGAARSSHMVFTPGFTGGVRVATANADGIPGDEIVVGAGPGGGPHVRVLTETGVELGSFMATDPGFTGGVYVAGGDVDGFPGDEVIVGLGGGGTPLVRVFHPDGRLITTFAAFDPAFRGGVRVAAADIDGDRVDEIVVGAGPGGGPMVRVARLDGSFVSQWFAYPEAFRGGVFVSSTRDQSGQADLVLTGAGDGGGPQVRAFDATGTAVAQFFAGRPNATTGVRVAGATFEEAAPGSVVLAGGRGARPLVRLTRLDGSLVFPSS